MSFKLLIVEDEHDIADILLKYSQLEGYLAEYAKDGEQALSLWRHQQPDLVLLDIQLPKISGLDVLKTIRMHSSYTAVIMLTARAEEIDQVLGLELGADDYVVKPFRPRELFARVKAVLRRTQYAQQPPDEAPIRIQQLELDPYKFQAKLAQQTLDVTPTEFRLLLTLAKQPGRVFSRLELIQEALPESDALERVVDAHMMHLRQKMSRICLEPSVRTVRGVGYTLETT